MTMIERVARAMWHSEPVIYAWGPQERHRISWEDAVQGNLAGVAIYRAFARAAIEAMREPTEAMAGAPYDANVRILTEAGAEPILDDAAREVWQAMIDAAKGEKS